MKKMQTVALICMLLMMCFMLISCGGKQEEPAETPTVEQDTENESTTSEPDQPEEEREHILYGRHMAYLILWQRADAGAWEKKSWHQEKKHSAHMMFTWTGRNTERYSRRKRGAC